MATRETSFAHYFGFATLLSDMNTATAKFAEALAIVEKLPVEDQSALMEVVNKRVAAARRAQLVRDVAEARADHRRGKVKRGSAADLIRELRGK
jgi:hypothetical protein